MTDIPLTTSCSQVVQFAGRRGRKPGSKNKVPRRRRLAEVGSGDEAAPLAVTSTRKRKRIRFDYVEVPQRKSVRFLESFHFEPLPPVPENPILRAMDVDAGSDDVEAAGQGSREYQVGVDEVALSRIRSTFDDPHRRALAASATNATARMSYPRCAVETRIPCARARTARHASGRGEPVSIARLWHAN